MNIVTILGGVRASIFAAIAVVVLVFGGVQTLRLSAANHRAEVQALALQVNAKDFAEWKLKQEAAAAAAVAEIDRKHREEQQSVQDKADRVVADLRNDVVQLRKRFTCPPRGESGSSDPSIGGVDAERIGGLTDEDAEFLVREAADSDRKSVKINALIDIIEEYLRKEEK